MSASERTTLVVNGITKVVAAPADTPLLWVLRDDFGCRSAKYGCGVGQCGACQVLVDDSPAASCQTALTDVSGRSVTTHEGLTGDPVYEAVVATLVSHNAGQCGYCLPGLVITLVSLARRPAAVGRPELLARLDVHLCRCGSQPRILRAAHELLDGARADR